MASGWHRYGTCLAPTWPLGGVSLASRWPQPTWLPSYRAWPELQQPRRYLRALLSPFASGRTTLAVMPDDLLRTIASAATRRPYGAHGDVYRQLRARHAEIAAILAKEEPSWRVIAEALSKAGIVGTKGMPPNRNSLPKVWHRVCQDIAAENALRLTGVKPSKAARRRKASAGYLPSGFSQSNASLPPGRVHQGSHPAALPAVPQQRPALPPTPGSTQGSSQPAPGSGAAMREEMNQRSGRKANGESKY